MKAIEVKLNYQLNKNAFDDIFIGNMERLGFWTDKGWSREFYEGYDGKTFYVKSFHWGVCTCERNSGTDEFNEPEEHDWECLIYKPNFIHKPTNLMISWYKHPLRGNSCNKDISINEFRDIMKGLEK